MEQILAILAFVGGLLGLGNYVSDGWTMLSGQHDYYRISNTVSLCLLITAGAVSAAVLLLRRSSLTADQRKAYLATMVLSCAALVVLAAWILFRAHRAS